MKALVSTAQAEVCFTHPQQKLAATVKALENAPISKISLSP